MGLCTEGLIEDLRRVNALLSQLQWSRITAQEVANDELRRHLTESLTEAIGVLRRGQEEVRLGLLRSILTTADGSTGSGITATDSAST